jgi:multiple sugar transport system permease protein
LSVSAPPLPTSPAPAPARRSRRLNQSTSRRIGFGLSYVVLVPVAILFLAPFAWMVSASMQHIGDMFSWPPQWVPKHPSLDGYKTFLGIGDVGTARGAEGAGRWFVNSAFVATSVTALQLFFNSLAAYVFAKRTFPGRDAIFLLFLGTMMVPGQITLIPNYLVMKHIPFFGGNDMFGNGGHGWLDSYYGLILPGCVSAFGVFLMRQYIVGAVPNELIAAARVDGAKTWRVFWHVILPAVRPIAAVLGLLTFMNTWNDFLWPYIVLNARNPTVQVAISDIATVAYVPDYSLILTACFVSILPLLAIFLLLGRQIIGGIMQGAIKG